MHPVPSQKHRSTVQFELDVPDKFKTELPTSKVQNGNSSTYSLSGFLLFNLKSVPLFAPPLAKNGGARAPQTIWCRRLCLYVLSHLLFTHLKVC